MAQRRRPVLGWREWVGLPELGIGAIKAKVDTGARTSAIHAEDVRTYTRAGRERVSFTVHPVQHSQRKSVRARSALVGTKRVRDSSGRVTERPTIETDLVVGHTRVPIELTLIDRDEMGFRMLLGRQAVAKRFWVDPGRSFLVGHAAGLNSHARRRRSP